MNHLKPKDSALEITSRIPSLLLPLFLCFAVLSSCANAERDTPEAETDDRSEHIVHVIALHEPVENRHLFQLSSREIPQGWTTFQFRNSSHVTHFFVIFRAPDEAIAAANEAGEPLLDHWYAGITEPFQREWNPFVNGDIEYGGFVDNLVAAIQVNGAWFFDPGAPPMGGPGFTAPGGTSETTVRLEPGEYIIECYVKDEDEQFHSYLGMLEHLTVTGEASGAEPPEPTMKVVISSENGIQPDREVTAGMHTVEVFFEDQASYDHLLGHNVQLARLSDHQDADLLEDLGEWMNWAQIGSLSDNPPEGVEFLGGSMEMTGGSTAYYTVNFTPGDYAWIAEVPDPESHGMLKTFTVAD